MDPHRSRVSSLSSSRSTQLHQDAVGRAGMEKADEKALRPRTRLPVNELQPGGCHPGERLTDIVHGEGNMMDPLAALLDVFGDRPLGRRRRQELDFCLPHTEKRGSDLLIRNFLNTGAGSSQKRFVQGDGCLKVPYGNTDMFDVVQCHGSHDDAFPMFAEDFPERVADFPHARVCPDGIEDEGHEVRLAFRAAS